MANPGSWGGEPHRLRESQLVTLFLTPEESQRTLWVIREYWASSHSKLHGYMLNEVLCNLLSLQQRVGSDRRASGWCAPSDLRTQDQDAPNPISRALHLKITNNKVTCRGQSKVDHIRWVPANSRYLPSVELNMKTWRRFHCCLSCKKWKFLCRQKHASKCIKNEFWRFQ